MTGRTGRYNTYDKIFPILVEIEVAALCIHGVAHNTSLEMRRVSSRIVLFVRFTIILGRKDEKRKHKHGVSDFFQTTRTSYTHTHTHDEK